MLISIIIPVYNSENFLSECLDSVLRQSYNNIEVILIDDGSTDSSPKICDNYAARDPRIKVIHKKNGGAGDARNHGLRVATGEYILFVDADDLLGDAHAISQAVDTLCDNVDIDLLLFDFTYLTEKGAHINGSLSPSRVNGESKIEALAYLISEDRFDSATCSKFIRREIITQNNISFIEGIRSEDYDWTLNIVLHSQTLHVLPSHFYHYRLWRGSVSATMSEQHLYDIWGTIRSWREKILQSALTPQIKGLYLDYLAYMYGFLMSRLYLIPNKQGRRRLAAEMKPLSSLLGHTRSRKVRRVAFLYRVLGFSLAWRVLSLVIRIRLLGNY